MDLVKRPTSMNFAWLSNRNALFWTLHLSGWVIWVITFAVIDLYEGHGARAVGYELLSAIAGGTLTACLRYLYRGIWERTPLVKVPVMFAGSFVLAMLWMAIVYFWICGPLFPDMLHNEQKEMIGFTEFVGANLGYSFFLFICWSALYFGVKYQSQFQEEQQRTLSAMAAANEAQVRMLRYQLNPHFLFNALNGISTLIMDEDNEAADRMVNRLSRFLRYSLDKDPLERVDLDHELGALELYLEIEKVRFEERLRVEISCEERARKCLIPSLLLQPLVENSIKYAVAEREEGGTIRIAARVFGDELLLEFTDDGPGMEADEESLAQSRGVGIRNIRERLQQVYGERQAFRLGVREPHGLKVTMRIPFEVAAGGAP